MYSENQVPNPRFLSTHPSMAYPSFAGLRPASTGSSRSKRSNYSRGTKHELVLTMKLRRLGLSFRRNVKDLLGKPDIVFPRQKLVVFCDGDFWHGRNWRKLRKGLLHSANSEYWMQKISMNRRRDSLVTRQLKNLGWKVIRLWETDIQRDSEMIANRIAHAINKRSVL